MYYNSLVEVNTKYAIIAILSRGGTPPPPAGQEASNSPRVQGDRG